MFRILKETNILNNLRSNNLPIQNFSWETYFLTFCRVRIFNRPSKNVVLCCTLRIWSATNISNSRWVSIPNNECSMWQRNFRDTKHNRNCLKCNSSKCYIFRIRPETTNCTVNNPQLRRERTCRCLGLLWVNKCHWHKPNTVKGWDIWSSFGCDKSNSSLFHWWNSYLCILNSEKYYGISNNYQSDNRCTFMRSSRKKFMACNNPRFLDKTNWKHV